MREAFRGIVICGAFVFVCAAGGCGNSNTVVARVGADAIHQAELSHWMSVRTAVDGPLPGGEAESRRRTLGLLLSSRWLTGEARELGLSVSEQEASKRLKLLVFDEFSSTPYPYDLPQDPELRRLLLSPKVGTPDRVWLMKLGMLAAKVEQERVTQAKREVTPAQIVSFYQGHKQQFGVPDQIDMEILGSYSQATVRKAKREIEAGTPFVTVARRVTVDPEAPNGRQHVIRGHEEPPFEKVIFPAPEHVLIGPVKYGFYYLFELLKKTPAHIQPLAQAQAAIRQQLAAGPGSSKLLGTFQAKWTARTTCSPEYVIPGCRQSHAAAGG